MNKLKKTKNLYAFLWEKSGGGEFKNSWHFNKVQEVIPETIIRGRSGIEIGSGCGYDTYLMAKNNPSVRIVSLDISDGVFKSKELTSRLRNVWIIKASALNIPVRDNTFDFAYSFGVLHHLSDPAQGLREIARIIKKDTPAYLYLYEDHSENRIKYLAIKVVSLVRYFTTKIPPKTLYLISFLLSPAVVFFFSYPAKVLKKFKMTQSLSQRFPFNFGTHPFSLSGDLYDRLGAPIEHRFNKEQIYSMLINCGFNKINITKLKDSAGWVTWGFKK